MLRCLVAKLLASSAAGPWGEAVSAYFKSLCRQPPSFSHVEVEPKSVQKEDRKFRQARRRAVSRLINIFK